MAKDDESLFAIDDLDLGGGCEEFGGVDNAVDAPEAEPLRVGIIQAFAKKGPLMLSISLA